MSNQLEIFAMADEAGRREPQGKREKIGCSSFLSSANVSTCESRGLLRADLLRPSPDIDN